MFQMGRAGPLASGLCYISIMLGMRTQIQTRCSGRLLTACLACLLAVQALIASVGLGMSAASPFGQPALDICSAAAADSANALAHHDNDKPQCPFCFVAAQLRSDAPTTRIP